eukprot:COSAG02_NODE_13557_length_1379_cov_1.579687_1_plen_112_part_10
MLTSPQDVLDNALRRIHNAIEASGQRKGQFFDALDGGGDGDLSLDEFEGAVCELSDDGETSSCRPLQCYWYPYCLLTVTVAGPTNPPLDSSRFVYLSVCLSSGSAASDCNKC